jgi:hypothetical protein
VEDSLHQKVEDSLHQKVEDSLHQKVEDNLHQKVEDNLHQKVEVPFPSSFFTKEHRGVEWRSLSSSSFWVFKNPMAVPGAVKLRRSKSIYGNMLSSSLSSFAWYSRMSFSKASILYAGILRSNHSSSSFFVSGGYKRAIETLWPVLLMKLGFFCTVGETKTWLKYHNLYINGYPTAPQKVWSYAIPADFFSTLSFPLYNSTHFKTFIQKMCLYI